jgi:hypothetical protein
MPGCAPGRKSEGRGESRPGLYALCSRKNDDLIFVLLGKREMRWGLVRWAPESPAAIQMGEIHCNVTGLGLFFVEQVRTFFPRFAERLVLDA